MDPYPYTFVAWVKIDEYNPDANTGAVVMGNYTGDLKGSIFYISNTGMLSIRPHPGVDLKGRTVIPIGGWTHIATTLEGSDLKVYVNGEEAITAPAAGTMSFKSGRQLAIGANDQITYPGTGFFTGVIDDFRIYNRALSEAEVMNLITALAVSYKAKLPVMWGAIKK